MNIENLYKELSNKLFETFYVDDLKYGRQLYVFKLNWTFAKRVFS